MIDDVLAMLEVRASDVLPGWDAWWPAARSRPKPVPPRDVTLFQPRL